MMRKRVLLVPDGMADERQVALGGRTPLEAADTPCMDGLARGGVVGLVQTVPEGMAAGSDVANLAVLGYDPAAVFSGRSPLEAASIGVELAPDDVSYRCNFVTIVDGVMKDITGDHISNDEGRRLIAALQAALGGGPFEFHAGVSYRNLLVWRGGELVPCTPPHDILDRAVEGYVPGVALAGGVPPSPASQTLADLQERAHDILAPLRPGTDIWLWGEGRAPRMSRWSELYGLSGAVVGAVDLVRGIGRLADLDVIDVPGATGDLDTDYGAKARATIVALDDHDFVWVHVEAPDEAAHMGDLRAKVRAIERIDAELLAPILSAPLRPAAMVLPDHHTRLSTRTHADPPVPFVISEPLPGSGGGGAMNFGETDAAATGLLVASGAELMRLFLEATG